MGADDCLLHNLLSAMRAFPSICASTQQYDYQPQWTEEESQKSTSDRTSLSTADRDARNKAYKPDEKNYHGCVPRPPRGNEVDNIIQT
jgi:hypothetical protein